MTRVVVLTTNLWLASFQASLGLLDKIEQVTVGQGLLENPFNPKRLGAGINARAGRCSNQQDRPDISLSAELLHKLQTGRLRHVIINDQAARLAIIIPQESVRAVVGGNRIAGRIQQEAKGFKNPRIILDDRNWTVTFGQGRAISELRPIKLLAIKKAGLDLDQVHDRGCGFALIG